MKYSQIFLMLAVMLGIKLFAQNTPTEIPEKLKNHYYDIVFPHLSPDNRFAVFIKKYEQISDTVVLVDMKRSNNILHQFPRTDVNSVKFTKSGNLYLKSDKNAQLLLLPSFKNAIWNEVEEGIYLEELNLISVFKKNTLILSDEFGKLIKTIPNVVSIKDRDNRLYYVQKMENRYELYVLEKNSTVLLHHSENPYLTAKNIGDTSYIIYEKLNGIYDMYFKDTTSGYTSLLRHNFQYGIDHIMENPTMIDKKHVFLNLAVRTYPKNRTAVEIWYGNDREIEKKTYADEENKILIWDPYTGEIIEPADTERTHLANVGNKRFFLSFDPLKNKDFINEAVPYTLFRYDFHLRKHEFLAEAGGAIYSDPTGKFLVTLKEGSWVLINIETGEKRIIPVNASRMVYFSDDGTTMLFEDKETISEYDIDSKKLKQIALPKGFRAKMLNGNYSSTSPGLKIFKTSYSRKNPVLFHLWNKNNNRNAIASYDGKDLKMIIAPTDDYISAVVSRPSQLMLTYVLSNINMPPQLRIKKGKKEQLIYNSENQDKKASEIRFDWVTSYNEKGVELKGVLIYPLNFKENKKYPMIVSVYESQRFESNQYLKDGMFGPTEGINNRHLIENGYFVFLPDIVYDNRGTGRSALDCVHSALDALKSNSSIDFSKIGLVGHSHGGYETNFIATQSDRFAAIVGGGGNSDLVRSYHSFNYNWSGPFFWQFEGGQYRMPGPFAQYKELYIDNSPVYHAEKVKVPILLWTGKEDQNIYWEQTMEFYLALRRNKKMVTALFYPEDDHSLQKTQNRVDLYTRINQWLGYYLKNEKSDWIQKMEN